ncbi:hypothetical protein [Deinococcus hopiensis]|nr:hypothetical protein [Deinococcus hopiensis]
MRKPLRSGPGVLLLVGFTSALFRRVGAQNSCDGPESGFGGLY